MIAQGTEGSMIANDWVGIVTVIVTIFALYASALAWLVGQSGRLRTETKRDIETELEQCRADFGLFSIVSD
jgi:hypothetical protein